MDTRRNSQDMDDNIYCIRLSLKNNEFQYGIHHGYLLGNFKFGIIRLFSSLALVSFGFLCDYRSTVEFDLLN